MSPVSFVHRYVYSGLREPVEFADHGYEFVTVVDHQDIIGVAEYGLAQALYALETETRGQAFKLRLGWKW